MPREPKKDARVGLSTIQDHEKRITNLENKLDELVGPDEVADKPDDKDQGKKDGGKKGK